MTRRRIRVLHIVDNLNYGGMERVVAEMTRRTDLGRFDPHLLAITYLGHFAGGLEEFASLHVARRMHKASMVRPSSLAADIRAIAPDIVHMHSGVWYKASLAAKMADVRVRIYTDHGRQNPDPWTYRAIDRRASTRTDVIVAVSEKLGGDMSRFVADPRRIRVIPNGVDTERYTFQPDDGALLAELGLEPGTPVIGSVGRLETVKGYEVMIAAFARLLERWDRGPRPVLVLIGDGSVRHALERQVARAGLRDSVWFLGWRNDIEERVHGFTLFTMSSHSEGTSVSLLEAMSSALCPVVTDVGGNAAVLGPALAHRLVTPNDPDALAAAWHDALCDDDRRRTDAMASRARIVEVFGLDAMVRQYESLYESAHRALSPR